METQKGASAEKPRELKGNDARFDLMQKRAGGNQKERKNTHESN